MMGIGDMGRVARIGLLAAARRKKDAWSVVYGVSTRMGFHNGLLCFLIFGIKS